MAAETTTSGSSSREAGVIARYRYCVYGIVVVSDTPLALPGDSYGGLGQVEFLTAPGTDLLRAAHGVEFDPRSNSSYECALLREWCPASVRWHGVGEFLVSTDGRRITCRHQEGASLESFQVYMLGQALSFALVKQGFEPLHATVAVVDDEAVAFLGHNAFGKSTLTACFLQAGHRLLTDDLLVLQQSSSRVVAYPGPPRIKLFPQDCQPFSGKHTFQREDERRDRQADPADQRPAEMRPSGHPEGDLFSGRSCRYVPEAGGWDRNTYTARGIRPNSCGAHSTDIW